MNGLRSLCMWHQIGQKAEGRAEDQTGSTGQEAEQQIGQRKETGVALWVGGWGANLWHDCQIV